MPLLNKGEEKVVLSLYNLQIGLMDSLSLAFNGSVTPFLTSREMVINRRVNPTILNNGVYLFTGLPEGRYDFFLKYKSFVLSREVDVEKDLSLTIVVPSTHMVKLKVVDNRGTPLSGVEVEVNREKVTLGEVTDEEGDVVFILPPGEYFVEMVYHGVSLAKMVLTVANDEKMVVAADFTPFYVPLFFIIVFVAGVLFSFFVIVKKLDLCFLLIIISMMLLLSSVFLPLWFFEGETVGYHVSSKIFVFPSTFITFKQADGFKVGEVAEVPSIFTTVLQAVFIMVLLEFVTLLLSLLFRRNKIVKSVMFGFSLFFAVSLVVVSYLFVSQLTAVTLGDVVGEGFIEFFMPDEKTLLLPSVWGFGSGWFFLVLSMVSLVFYTLVEVFRKKLVGLFKSFVYCEGEDASCSCWYKHCNNVTHE
ncbi:MAG TPA: carboxypeptidase regulatory-like domain-containing protein [Thermoplasmatales archaeon]|nr:carboxypeptidase regulatory-like domain-containing protein [Thermoplasmatales archaeon]